MEKQKKVVVRAIARNKTGKVLLGERASFHGNGLLALFGGKPDQGESVIDALKREMIEETNLKISNIKKFRVDEIEDEEVIWVAHYFICDIDNEEEILINSEHARFVYVDINTLREYQLAFDHDLVLQSYFESISSEINLNS